MTPPHDQFRLLWPVGPDVERVLDSLVTSYSQPWRRYHTMEHIAACLAEFERLCPLPDGPERDAARVALWFHDVHYEPRAVNNEYRSSKQTANICRFLGRPELSEMARVAVLATKHGSYPCEGSVSCYVVDADLSILGAEPDVFDEYERAIRKEYEHVPEAAFRAGRAAILRGFLDGERIFRTELFSDRYEAKARENLRRSLEALS